ncbi:MAG: hypothetical protein P8X47_13350 [Ignavibacteriaceae bacterium]
MQWINILHFYQPPFQDLAVVKKVTDECYLPVTKLLLDHPNASCIVNINGCLLDMLGERIPRGKSVISNLTKLIRNEQIEITGTGKYHPIFPLIPRHEIEKQIRLQENSLKRHLGVKDQPAILFLPEMAYLPEQAQLFREKGYAWVIIDQSSLQNGTAKMGKYQLSEKESKCKLLVRDREISESLGNSIWQKITIENSQDFINHAQKKNNGESFVTTATDVEVFGHHQKNRWKLLKEMYTNVSIKSILPQDIVDHFDQTEVNTVPSSWSTEKNDQTQNIYYPLWFYPQNRLHRMLWQLLDITLDETRRHGNETQNGTVDTLLSSCPFFWASCRPWWNGMIVEKAADQMVDLVSALEGIRSRIVNITESIRIRIYDEISLLNTTGRAVEMQTEFLKKHKINPDKMQSSLL